MTIEDAANRVQEIYAERKDQERAHGMEDKLWEDVLRAIANGAAPDPIALAAVALQTTAIEFERWYA